MYFVEIKKKYLLKKKKKNHISSLKLGHLELSAVLSSQPFAQGL